MGAEVLAIVSWCGVEARHMPNWGMKPILFLTNSLHSSSGSDGTRMSHCSRVDL